MAQEQKNEGGGEDEGGGEERRGVLLYYKFTSLSDPRQLSQWFQNLCSSLSLLGRIRIAPDGVNVTVGGTMDSLRKHIVAVEKHPSLKNCDFKLAESSKPVNTKLAAECGFDSLSVRLVKELITLGLHPSLMPSIENAGEHLDPEKFHQVLQGAGHADSQIMLLDARNIYETRIGSFSPPARVEFVESFSRQYSDLPIWIDRHLDQLCNKYILMYCTGGVRCEMASAYIRSKGEGFQDVFQLSGGIHRYLEAYPDGGYFKGKNFVFDYRIAVPSSVDQVIGSCLTCGNLYDDYSSRIRCSKCRMLILICARCQVDMRRINSLDPPFMCELCKNHCGSILLSNEASKNDYTACAETEEKEVKSIIHMPSLTTPTSRPGHACFTKRKLRVLCLHGFRQTASSLKGRLGSLRKKLKHVLEFVFVDAPHELSFTFQRMQTVFPAMGDQEVPGEGPLLHNCNKKYGWLIGRGDLDIQVSRKHSFDPLQYQTQTVGWPDTWTYLQKVFGELGPFDGVLGFSQGAAVAAALCPLRSRANLTDHSVNFSFVILCSGFPSPAYENKMLMPGSRNDLLFDCPSLHIFCGNGGCDRQIARDESEKLASMFSENSRTIVEHNSGHMIPTQPEYILQYLSFLSQFL